MRRVPLFLATVLLAFSASAEAPLVVTEQNLLENDRLWPYHVGLTRAVESLEVGTIGVLMRVEPAGRARVDFGRDGVHEVPIDATNLVERANGVRLGQVHKAAPNFVLAIGPRLIDTKSDPPRAVPFEAVSRYDGFLALYADPGAEGFAALAKALAPLAERRDLLVVLFPQGELADPAVYTTLRSSGWKAPYVSANLSASYTRARLRNPKSHPTLQLLTPNGRVLFESGWQEGVVPKLMAAIDSQLGGATETAASPPAE